MKRFSAITAVLGTLALALTACGGHDSSSASHQSSSASASSSAAAASVAPPSATATGSPTSGTAAPASNLGPASSTTCSAFKKMNQTDGRALMQKVLAENPGSKFDRSPDVALGTATLVCLEHSAADKPIAVAIGIAQ